MFKITDLKYSYNSSKGFEYPDVELKNESDLLVLGKSGSGKTTYLHLLAGLLKPKSGSIEIGDTDICQLDEGQLATFRGNNIGVVFQTAHFVSAVSIMDNLLLTQKLAGLKQDRQHIIDVLDSLGLEEKVNSLPKRLSVGEQQRASIARAIINRPSVILADEPTSALDDQNCKAVVQLLREQSAKSNAKLIIVTHDQRLKDEFQNQLSL